MRDTLTALLILALAVGWFSAHGPASPIEERNVSGWVMPGEGAGTELVQDGAGMEAAIVDVPVPVETEAMETPGGESAREEIPVTVTEEERMDPFMTGCIVGGALVLAGVFASPIAAWLWEKITRNT